MKRKTLFNKAVGFAVPCYLAMAIGNPFMEPKMSDEQENSLKVASNYRQLKEGPLSYDFSVREPTERDLSSLDAKAKRKCDELNKRIQEKLWSI